MLSLFISIVQYLVLGRYYAISTISGITIHFGSATMH